MSAAAGVRPLLGKRVIEFGTGYVAPVASMYLGVLGAEVIKVEHRQNPDFMRGDIRNGQGITPSFADANRGKRSVAIDVKTAKGRDLVHRLLTSADVLIENLGAGAMKRLGCSYGDVRSTKNDIVMASLQGLGADVEHSTTLGQNIPPLIGLTHLWNHPGGGRPVGSQLFHPDYYAGVFSAVLILAALDDRRRTGRGHFIDSAQAEVAASLLGPWYLACEINKENPQPLGNRGAKGVPAGCFPCQGSDRWCFIVVHDDEEWLALKAAAGEADWAQRTTYETILGRLRHRAQLEEEIGNWTSVQNGPDLMQRLQSHGVHCGLVASVAEMAANQHLQDSGFVRAFHQRAPGDFLFGGVPLFLDESRVELHGRAPLIGEHTIAVLDEWLGLNAEELEQLRTEHVIDVATNKPGQGSHHA
jgi:benzylsuccinate CoA-transferase BbsF subunit